MDKSFLAWRNSSREARDNTSDEDSDTDNIVLPNSGEDIVISASDSDDDSPYEGDKFDNEGIVYEKANSSSSQSSIPSGKFLKPAGNSDKISPDNNSVQNTLCKSENSLRESSSSSSLELPLKAKVKKNRILSSDSSSDSEGSSKQTSPDNSSVQDTFSKSVSSFREGTSSSSLELPIKSKVKKNRSRDTSRVSDDAFAHSFSQSSFHDGSICSSTRLVDGDISLPVESNLSTNIKNAKRASSNKVIIIDSDSEEGESKNECNISGDNIQADLAGQFASIKISPDKQNRSNDIASRIESLKAEEIRLKMEVSEVLKNIETTKQKHEFALLDHKQRLNHYKGVFRSLQARVDSVGEPSMRAHWEHVIKLLGSGLHPSTRQVLTCKTLFAEKPYHLNSLYSSHLKELLKIHSMHTGWRRKIRLGERAKLILLMDKAICKEGGVSCLSQDEIRSVCLMRGLNPANMKREDMEEWLRSWLQISQTVSEDTLSLLLHSPVLLTYNHPSNWVMFR